jgi:hypothetical protein
MKHIRFREAINFIYSVVEECIGHGTVFTPHRFRFLRWWCFISILNSENILILESYICCIDWSINHTPERSQVTQTDEEAGEKNSRFGY